MMDARAGTLAGHAAAGGAARERGALGSGIVGGLLGGAAMALFMSAAASAAGLPAWQVLRAVGTTFVGAGSLGGTGQVLYGAALHGLVSAAVGLAFAGAVPRDFPPGSAAVLGLGYAFFLAGIMASLVIPAVNPGFREQVQPVGGAFVVAHALYGVVLGLWHARGGRTGPGAAGP